MVIVVEYQVFFDTKIKERLIYLGKIGVEGEQAFNFLHEGLLRTQLLLQVGHSLKVSVFHKDSSAGLVAEQLLEGGVVFAAVDSSESCMLVLQ